MYKRWAPPKSTRDLRHWLRIIKKAKTWQLIIVLILCSFIAATFLRLNNLGMIERREAVYSADREGDPVKIKLTLVELQHYVASHMNTSLGKGVSLFESYNRDYKSAVDAAADTTNPNSSVYQQASVECQARFQGGVESFRNDYVTCVQNAVNSLSEAQINAPQLPRGADYTYNFASPLISFDLAGIFTVISITLALFIIFRLTLFYLLKWMIKRRVNI